MEDYCSLNKKRRSRVSTDGQPFDTVLAPAPSNCFPGSRTMLHFGAFNGLDRSSFDLEDAASDYFDEYFNQPEKKHRLSIDQVKFLERKFDEDSRLEPERKMQLAKELNLQPRQITIWFQNRRARSRTKQLETDYEALHESYAKLKNEYDDVLKENDRLKSQILCLKSEGGTDKSSNLQSEERFPVDVPIEDISGGLISPEDEETVELTFAKSDVTCAESPQIQYFHLESNALQNERDEFLDPFANFLESVDGSSHGSNGSFFYEFPLEEDQEQQALNFWPY